MRRISARESVGVLREKLKEEQMEDLFEKIEMPLVFTLYEMEKNGVKIASDELHAYGQMLGEKIKELEESIYEMAGEVFNINSPKQLGVILFEKMELPNKKKTKTGYSTAAGCSGETGSGLSNRVKDSGISAGSKAEIHLC